MKFLFFLQFFLPRRKFCAARMLFRVFGKHDIGKKMFTFYYYYVIMLWKARVRFCAPHLCFRIKAW